MRHIVIIVIIVRLNVTRVAGKKNSDCDKMKLDWHSSRKKLLAVWAQFVLVLRYVLADMRRNKRNMAIGISTVMIVVAFVALLQNAVVRSPIVFTKLSENQVGEYDLLMSPRDAALSVGTLPGASQMAEAAGGADSTRKKSVKSSKTTRGDEADAQNANSESSNNNNNNGTWIDGAASRMGLLDETLIAERLHGVKGVRGTAPRWTMLARVASKDEPSRNGSGIVLAIDSDRERSIGLGRDWQFRALGEREAYVSSSLLRQIGIEPRRGERVVLTIPLLDLMGGEPAIDEGALRSLAEASFRQSIRSRNFTVPVNGSVLMQALGLPVPPGGLPLGLGGAGGVRNVTLVGSTLPDAAIDRLVDQYFDAVYPSLVESLRSGLSAEFTVVDGVDEPRGKWPSALGNVVVIESKFVPRLVRTLLPENRAAATAFMQMLGIRPSQIENIENFPMNVCYHSKRQHGALIRR
jgi:hypothetical protein